MYFGVRLFLLVLMCRMGWMGSMRRWWAATLPCNVTQLHSGFEVDCSGQKLTKMPKDIPINTTKLVLAQNHIRSISQADFKDLHGLLELDFSQNCPHKSRCNTSIDIGGRVFGALGNLKKLYLNDNYLQSIPKCLPSSLEELYMKSNKITHLNKSILESAIHLHVLYLDFNCFVLNQCSNFTVEHDAFAKFKHLRNLSLSSNNMSTIPQNLPCSLLFLNLSNCNLKRVDKEDFKNLNDLEILDLSRNCPRCYNAPYLCIPCPGNVPMLIADDTFSEMPNLTHLVLRSMSLHIISENMFQNNTRLTYLDLSLNYLARPIAEGTFLVHLSNVTTLDLSFNYEPSHYFKSLNLSNNFSSLTSLNKLFISGYVFEKLEMKQLEPLRHLHNLQYIEMSINFIKQLELKSFDILKKLNHIVLTENKISPPTDKQSSKGSTTPVRKRRRSGLEWERATINSGNGYQQALKRSCTHYGKSLDLSLNNIFFVTPQLFANMTDIKCLNLSTNAMGQTLNGSQFNPLTQLKYLDLSFNRLDLFFPFALTELTALEVLDLSFNAHYFAMEGIVHNINFISNMHCLKVLNLSNNGIQSLSRSSSINSSTLTTVIFRGNRLDVLWSPGNKRFVNLFGNFTNLEYLDLSSNSLKSVLLDPVLSRLCKIKTLLLASNSLSFFPWSKALLLPNLGILDLSDNNLVTLSPNVKNLALYHLDLSHNQITSLPNWFLQNLPNLTVLDVSFNKLTASNATDFPTSELERLDVLGLRGNPFGCTCGNGWFSAWLNDSSVIIPLLAVDVLCDTPDSHRGCAVVKALYTKACSLVTLGRGLSLFFATTILIMVFGALAGNRWHWELAYGLEVLRARWRGGYWDVKAMADDYDAYVDYDVNSVEVSEWVLHELRIQLEEGTGRPLHLCLEERDWVPGISVVHNLSESILQSRKTIFVLTRDFAGSCRFQQALGMAQQRLLDEGTDVIVFVLLEEPRIPSRYLQLRQRVVPGSVLHWPLNPQAQGLFWHDLHKALAPPLPPRCRKDVITSRQPLDGLL
uniref:toll-like receptor 7 n=1 Tax=Myxine glutinosa TaxID=7769 RepID=UPI00358E8BBE